MALSLPLSLSRTLTCTRVRPRALMHQPAAVAALAVAAGLFGAPSGARAEIIDLQFDTQGRFEREVNVAPSKFVELCGKLPAGTQVQWRYEAAAPLDFNIHYHVGKDVKFPAKEEARAASHGTLKADSDQDFCWMWSNRSKDKAGAAVPMRVQLQRQN